MLLRLRDDVAEGAADGADDAVEEGLGEVGAEATIGEEVVVDRGDFLENRRLACGRRRRQNAGTTIASSACRLRASVETTRTGRGWCGS